VYTFLIVIYVIVAFLLVLAILMQSSKGGGLSGSFGGVGGSALFGGRGAATFLSKVTTGLAVAFMVISILIGLVSAPRGKPTSIIRQEANRRISPSADLPVPEGSLDEEAPESPAGN
jgi:preprotein translocase subunit SecG